MVDDIKKVMIMITKIINSDNHIKLEIDVCAICGLPFTDFADERRIKAHMIPKMLNPKFNVIIPLHAKCEDKINALYFVHQKKNERLPTITNANFGEFKQTYKTLKERFDLKQIDRSEFGTGLWTNLISYLTNLEERQKQ